MAIKAMCAVRNAQYVNDTSGDLVLTMNISVRGTGHDNVEYGPVDFSSLTLRADLVSFVKDYATAHFGVTFDVLDSVGLIYPISVSAIVP